MLATLIVAGGLARGLCASEKGGFRLAALEHCSIQSLSPRDTTFRDQCAISYHQFMARMLDSVADLRGEPQRLDAFPERSFGEIVEALNEIPSSAFPPFNQPGQPD
jgi:hypothetical protein